MNRMPDTSELQSWLDRWAARRALARRMLGLARTLATALAAALVLFVFDWLLRRGTAVRIPMLVAWLTLIAFAARRWLRTRRSSSESRLDLALILERRKKLEGDLVAALQFDEQTLHEPPPVPVGGQSRQLRLAVIGYVAEYAKSLRPEPIPWSASAYRTLAALIALLGIWAWLVARSPDTVAAFGRRLLLGQTRYPTLARIESIHINGRPWSSGRAVKAVAGEPLTISVVSSGEAPRQGRVIAHDGAGRSMTLPLTRAAAGHEHVARLPALVDELRCVVSLGDAWGEKFQVLPIERPRAVLKLLIQPPDYARGAPPHDRSASSALASANAEIVALAGSRIDVEVVCDNKPLAEVVLIHEGREFDLSQAGGRRRWRLASAPRVLQTISRDTALNARVVDVDGLSPDDALSCAIRALADQPPTARAEALTTMIVPGARPTIVYHVADDVGLAKLLVERVIVRSGESRRLEPIEIAVGDRPTAVDGQLQLDTGELLLQSGDELQATLAAIDFRGADAGHHATSDVLRFRVANEAGVLAALAGDTERSKSADPDDEPPVEAQP